MKVSLEISSEYIEPYAIVYADRVTDEIQRMIEIFGKRETPITALEDEENLAVLKADEIYMVKVENGDTISHTVLIIAVQLAASFAVWLLFIKRLIK